MFLEGLLVLDFNFLVFDDLFILLLLKLKIEFFCGLVNFLCATLIQQYT